MIRKVVVIGLDGFDPTLTERLMRQGDLPGLSRLRQRGDYRRLATSFPPQTPVAWSSFATGCNPGVHGIFDFLRRDPQTHGPENALFGFRSRSAFLPPQAVNRRSGRPLWDSLTRAGVPATILRHPCTFPPDSGARALLAGVGVPDLRGGFGTGTWLSADPRDLPSGEAERVVHLVREPDGSFSGHLLGPLDRSGTDSRFPVRVRPREGGVQILSRGDPPELDVAAGGWSSWLRVRFPLGPLTTARGIVRFHLSRLDPPGIHATPVGYDPQAPPFPLSHPWEYAGQLQERIGPFQTLGLAEDHGGLEAGRLDEDAYLAQCRSVLAERRAMALGELDALEEGLFFCLFDTPDRIQHMFWRFLEGDHPANRVHATPPSHAGTIEEHYRECDRLVTELVASAGDALVLVLSDHGFASFRRELHLNTWLLRQGLLALKPGSEGEGPPHRAVDWSRTQAYALGLAGIYVNRRGREACGGVEPEDAAALERRIMEALTAERDGTGAAPVRRVLRSADLYRGPRAGEAPDLVVCCERGWRVSGTTALGGVAPDVFSDNERRWSGDHVVDPVLVPGVLFSSQPLGERSPALEDLAPTILAALGVPAPREMEGRSLLP